LGNHQHRQRFRGPTVSHGRLDRQPNDRLGRIWPRGLFEHWWQILRAGRSHANAHGDSNADGNSNSYDHTHSYANAHADTDGNSDSQCNSNSHIDAHTYANAYCDGNRHGIGNSNLHGDNYRNANTNSYRNRNANTMHGKMFTYAAAAPQCECAINSATSFNTAAYCFTERHPSTAAHSATAALAGE
jgi:hypothetical protein